MDVVGRTILSVESSATDRIVCPTSQRRPCRGFTMLELVFAMAIVGILAATALPRFLGNSATTKKNTCYTLKGNIEVQTQLWYRNKGTWPANNLGDIGANASYFPEGLPQCPVDGSSYTVDATTHRVVGHTH